ncbi:MAG: hypothetical protein ABI166_05745 [Mucilaginibacter sp.]
MRATRSSWSNLPQPSIQEFGQGRVGRIMLGHIGVDTNMGMDT